MINPVYLEEDSNWTIEARTKHYHVPGVSIAVINNGKITWMKSYGVIENLVREDTNHDVGELSRLYSCALCRKEHHSPHYIV